MVFYIGLIRWAGYRFDHEIISSCSTNAKSTASSLLLNLEKLVVDSIFVTKTISTNKDQIREILWALDRLKTILSFFITPGLSEDIDSICYGKLGAYTSTAIPGSVRYITTIWTYASANPVLIKPWCNYLIYPLSSRRGMVHIRRTDC